MNISVNHRAIRDFNELAELVTDEVANFCVQWKKGLDELLKGRTSFIIAHRLSTIKNSSRIMYIDDGRIVECGTHDELMSLKGHYYNLYQSQYALLKEAI